MNFSALILRRRSVRKYTKEEIPDEKLNAVVSAGLLSPSSMNKKPCQFYVIRNKDILNRLSKAKKMGAGFLADASAAIAVFADENKSDVWIEDCSIALSYMNLMAAEQGLGSCWCQIRRRSSLIGKDAEDNVRKILDVPGNFRIVGILALGISAQDVKPHSPEEIDKDRIHYVD